MKKKKENKGSSPYRTWLWRWLKVFGVLMLIITPIQLSALLGYMFIKRMFLG